MYDLEKSFSIKTLGCKLNQYESSLIARALVKAGWIARPFGEPVDIAIVNTCSLTDKSDKKSRAAIRQGARLSRPGKAIATGCWVDADQSRAAQMPEALAAFRNRDKERITARLAELLASEPPPENRKKTLAPRAFSRIDGYLKIQEGCAGHCSYCVVPSVRGAPDSRQYSSILTQAERLISEGRPEIILTGITIGAYQDSGRDLAGLVEEILNLPGNFRLRITSVEPTHFNDRLIELLGHEKLCPHLHLPLQSGSDRVLKSMQRPYSAGEYLEIVKRIVARRRRIAIGTDVIVGYPIEEEADFVETLNVIEKAGFSYVHRFSFSSRSATPAILLEQKNTGEVIAERMRRVKELSAATALVYRKQFVGEKLPCVVEKGGRETYRAVSGNYLKIALADSPLNQKAEGTLAEVEITSVDAQAIRGKLV